MDNDAKENMSNEVEILMAEAQKDLEFDETNVDRISLRIPLLQEKYARKLMHAKARLRNAEFKLKALEADLHEHYTTNYPLKVDRRDVDKYLWKDKKFVDAHRMVESHKMVTDYIQSVLNSLNQASWNINNFIKMHLWKNGHV